jgi:hypothetical protein
MEFAKLTPKPKNNQTGLESDCGAELSPAIVSAIAKLVARWIHVEVNLCQRLAGPRDESERP